VGAFCVYLADYQLLPYARIRSLFADLFAAPLSPATVSAFAQRAGTYLKPLCSAIREGLCGQKVLHCDETGLRIGGGLHWLHVASTPTLTYYTWHNKRGQEGLHHAGILPHFGGIAVHDGWSAYHHYPCRHALCNAHHLRELTALYEQQGQEWARKMRSLLARLHQRVKHAREQGHTCLPTPQRAAFLGHYFRLIEAGYGANPPPPPPPGHKGRQKHSEAQNLLARLLLRWREVLAFAYDFAVPFDNNLAERDLRMMKVKQKVSGGFRTAKGAEAFCRIRSYLSTMQTQGHSLLTALEHVFRGTPLYPETAG
jgi:transposase